MKWNTEMSETPAVWTNHGDAIYVNADKSAVVPGDSPEAAYLLVAEGGTLPLAEAQKYDLIGTNLPDRGRGRSKAPGPDVAREEDEDEALRKAKKDVPENKGRG
jgi:hypothetical protein